MKHTLSVLVEDESGALSRISGLFARRGFNIDSLAVGPAETKGISRLTMVVEGDNETLQQMTKQLNKLFNVLGVVDFTNLAAVERELMLLKVSSKEDTRSNILDIVQIFRAKVVDVSDIALTLEVVGDPGKLVALDTTKNLLERIQTKIVYVTTDKKTKINDNTFESLKVISNDENKLVLSYEKSKLNIDSIISEIKKQDIKIQDISTDDGDLEDVFLRLTKN